MKISGKCKAIIFALVAVILIEACGIAYLYASNNNDFLRKRNAGKGAEITEAQKKASFITWNDWAFINVGQTLVDPWQYRGTVAYDENAVPYYMTAALHKSEKGVDINVLPAWDVTRGSEKITVGIIGGNEEAAPTTVSRVAEKTTVIYKAVDTDAFWNNEDKITLAVDAIQDIIDAGARIVNIGWSVRYDSDKLRKVIEDNPNVLFVCSSTELLIALAIEERHIAYPADYDLPNVISVVPIDSCGNVTELMYLGSRKPDIAAPGIEIRAGGEDFLRDETNGFEAAFVSGAAALIMAERTDITASELKNALMNGVTKSAKLKDACTAGGYLNVYACLTAK